jgi:hypothetical protein
MRVVVSWRRMHGRRYPPQRARSRPERQEPGVHMACFTAILL